MFQEPTKKHLFTLMFLVLFSSSAFIPTVFAWSNGGYSSDPSNPDYGTHDWIAQHALDWLPSNEKEYIQNNLATYLYGTELPDNSQASDGIGDTSKHHIYYFSNGTLQDDSSAIRASEEYNIALSYLKVNDFINAAKHTGIMTHYIADMAVFGHVMGSSTDWGAEQHHSDYEDYANYRTNSYNDDFNIYLSYDGSLNTITAYNAARNLANDTTFDVDGDLTCVWMDQHYDWSNSVFVNRCGESLNLAVNYLTDVLHTLYTSRSNVSSLNQVVINEFELNPIGNDNELTVFEWVELYNPTASSVNISGWALSTTHGTMVTLTIPSNTTLAINGYYICERGQQWLDNTDESIILKNSDGVEIDRTSTKSDNDNDNFCWARFPNGYDTNSSSDWRFQLATKGASNEKASSSISCGLSSTSPEIGSSITVSGTITPSRSGVIVNISYTMPNGTIIERMVTACSDGSYSDTYTPAVVGSWSVKADWSGDSLYDGATSSSKSFTVSKIASSVSCSVSSTSTRIDFNIIVYGSISPTHSGVSVTISYKTDSWSTLTTVTCSSNGSYTYTWTPASAGSYQFKASWDGDSSYNGAISDVASVTVVKVSTSITCSVSPSEVTIGNSITISGSINPTILDKTVTLTFRKPYGSSFNRTVTTGSDGSYSDSYTPDAVGSWNVSASWEGDSSYTEAISTSKSFIVSKISTTISCSVSSSNLTIGDSVTVSGSISPTRSGVTVTISYKSDGSFSTLFTVTSASDGSYSYSWKPTDVGSYQLKASWAGDSTYSEATSDAVSVAVNKISTTLSCKSSSSEITDDDTITVSGSISSAVSGKTVTLTYTKPDGKTTVTRTVTTGSDGSYSDSYKPDTTGSWSVKASWDGDVAYAGVTSSAVSFTVSKISSTISCSVSPSEVTEGDSVTVLGSISPSVSGKSITLTYKKPDGATFTRTVTTGSDGSYSNSYKPEALGSWSVTASWDGDSTYSGASSQSRPFTVKKSGCLIATATYGSELSPYVQFLRGFRDDTVLTTFAGSSFMSVFNMWYYSFSPSVASSISGNGALRGVMKVVLYPLIGLLHVSSTTFSLFSFNPEMAVVMAGLVASALIGVVYFAPWALLLSFLRRFKPPAKIIRLTGLVWCGSIFALFLAEVTASSPLMMLATGIFVLATICLTTLAAVKAVVKRHTS